MWLWLLRCVMASPYMTLLLIHYFLGSIKITLDLTGTLYHYWNHFGGVSSCWPGVIGMGEVGSNGLDPAELEKALRSYQEGTL